MKHLEIQAIKLRSGDTEIETKRAGDVVRGDEITVGQCMDMLAEHGMDSERMIEIAEAFLADRREEGSEQTWVVRDVSDFPESSKTRYCEIVLMCGIVD